MIGDDAPHVVVAIDGPEAGTVVEGNGVVALHGRVERGRDRADARLGGRYPSCASDAVPPR